MRCCIVLIRNSLNTSPQTFQPPHTAVRDPLAAEAAVTLRPEPRHPGCEMMRGAGDRGWGRLRSQGKRERRLRLLRASPELLAQFTGFSGFTKVSSPVSTQGRGGPGRAAGPDLGAAPGVSWLCAETPTGSRVLPGAWHTAVVLDTAPRPSGKRVSHRPALTRVPHRASSHTHWSHLSTSENAL